MHPQYCYLCSFCIVAYAPAASVPAVKFVVHDPVAAAVAAAAVAAVAAAASAAACDATAKAVV